MKLKKLQRSLPLLAILCFQSQASGVILVDWLKPVPTNTQDFALENDNQEVVGNVSTAVPSGFLLENGGVRQLSNAHWENQDRELLDSVTGDLSVDGFATRVAPIGGAAAWTLSINVLEPGSWYLMVGSLFRDAVGENGPLTISASQDSQNVELSYLGSESWSPGTGDLSGAVGWNEALQTFSATEENGEESALGVFLLSDFGGSNSQIVIDVPSGFTLGSGDDVVFALGFQQIPEPSSVALLFLAFSSLFGVRKRPSVS